MDSSITCFCTPPVLNAERKRFQYRKMWTLLLPAHPARRRSHWPTPPTLGWTTILGSKSECRVSGRVLLNSDTSSSDIVDINQPGRWILLTLPQSFLNAPRATASGSPDCETEFSMDTFLAITITTRFACFLSGIYNVILVAIGETALVIWDCPRPLLKPRNSEVARSVYGMVCTIKCTCSVLRAGTSAVQLA